jgi:hypothetical protein
MSVACRNTNQPSNYGEGGVLQQETERYNFILSTFCLSFIACLHLTHFLSLNFKCIFSITVACRQNNQHSNYWEERVVAAVNWAVRIFYSKEILLDNCLSASNRYLPQHKSKIYHFGWEMFNLMLIACLIRHSLQHFLWIAKNEDHDKIWQKTGWFSLHTTINLLLLLLWYKKKYFGSRELNCINSLW